jgi:tetratricopeptide (TPR) repeat protein
MTMVNRLKAAAVMLGAAAAITSAWVWGEPSGGKTTVSGFNPGGVKLRDDLLTNRFTRQPVVTYETQDGETLFALQVKPAVKAANARARDLVVIVDTSASQAGKFLDTSRKVAEQIILNAASADRVSVWVINTPKATRNLTGGLKEAEKLRDADPAKGLDKTQLSGDIAKALESEYASGSVDLKNGIEKALNDFEGRVQRQQAIVFIGDAESAFAPLSEKDRFQLAGKVREAKVQFFAVPIGLSINSLNLHSLVMGSGGGVARFSDEITDQKKAVAHVATRLNEELNTPVLFPTKFDLTGVAEFYPTRLPPLRGDQPTLIVGKFTKGKAPAKLEGSIEGRVGAQPGAKVSFSEAVPAAGLENFFLTTVVRQWSESDLKDAPALLRADRTLALAFEQGRLTREEYLTQAQWALGANQFEAAKNLAGAAQKLDPADAEVKALGKVINKLEKGELTLEKLKAATGQRIGVQYEKQADGKLVARRVNLEAIAQEQPPPQPKEPNAVPGGDPKALLQAEQARRAIIEQQVNLTVQETLQRGRELLRAGDPKAAKDLIVAQRDSIRANPDIGEALRTVLLGKMDLLLTDVGQRGERIIRERAEENERIARARARLMATENMQAREERIRERIKAFTNLMAQARFEDAYREALVMMQEAVNEAKPIPIEAQAVYQMGQAATNLREMRELTRIREDRFLLTMMQVEKSHIPYPDEPPVHFPPSKVWKDLLELRKRYAASDFEGDLPARVRKRMDFLKSALDNPITEIDKGEVALPFLLDTVAALASPPGFDKDPSRKVTILIDVDAFRRERMDFDPERVQIKFQNKLVGVSLATVLRLICEQIDGTYWVRRDYIEIVPADMAIREKVIRVFPVEDLIIGIPNAVNTSALSQSLAVLGQQFSLAGGFTGQPIAGAFGGFGGGFQFFGGGGGMAGQAGIAGGAVGGLFQGGVQGGIAGFGGGIQGQFGNLGGQFGFQGQDYGPILVRLITEVVAKGEWSINNNAIIGGGGPGMGGEDPPMDMGQLPAEKLNSLGYWPPARALIIRGTSRIHRTNSSKLTKKDMAVNFVPNPQANAGGNGGGNIVAKVDPKSAPRDPAVPPEKDPRILAIVEKVKDLDPERIYQMVLEYGVTEPGEIIACVDFMVQARQFKHAAELLKASLRSGVVAEPWAQEALAIALEGSQGSAEEIERARLSAIDLSPKSPHAYLKASKAMSELGDPDKALTYCRVAAKLEPGLPDAYVNALAYAADPRAKPNADNATYFASNLLGRDWATDSPEYHLRAREFLKDQAAKFVAANKPEEAKKVQAILDSEKRRDLVIQLLWSEDADLDLKVREPIGTVCSSLSKQTTAGGTLLCDDFTQKNDNHSETYTAAEAFNGSYEVTVDRVWGRSLNHKAAVVVTKHQGTPEQTVDLFTLQITAENPHPKVQFSFEGGRRKTLASVPPPGAPVDSVRKPERGKEVMDKLRAMTSGTSGVMVGMGGGVGSTSQPAAGFAVKDDQSPLVELALQTSVNSVAPGGLELQQQTVLSKDGRKLQIRMAPVFQTAGAASPAKLKLDVIPGGE